MPLEIFTGGKRLEPIFPHLVFLLYSITVSALHRGIASMSSLSLLDFFQSRLHIQYLTNANLILFLLFTACLYASITLKIKASHLHGP